ncbi:MAG: glycosyltransferase family 2 protein [Candidatus Magasanikbacteria bacterium]
MNLSIITVTWNNKKNITEQINSVFKGCKEIICEEIISDNGSKDGTVDYIKKEFPNVKVVENNANIGFGPANNTGVEIAQGHYLLFLNPDMRVQEGSLDIMVKWMDEHVDVGIGSCKLVDTQGNFKPEAGPRRFPTVLNQIALILKLPHIFPKILDSYLMKDFDPEKEQEVDTVRGAFMLMRREVVEKLGWAWDPRYFFWFEDVDICREVKKLGMKVMYTPVVTCVDYVGQSFKKRTTLWKQKQFTKSMSIYFKKWEPWWKWMWIALLRPIGIFMAWVNDKLSK